MLWNIMQSCCILILPRRAYFSITQGIEALQLPRGHCQKVLPPRLVPHRPM